jgi:magnesium-transporting ATPase (P-type)
MHSVSSDQVAALLRTSADGLDDEEVRRRLAEYGPNSVEVEATSRWLVVLLHQFASPLIFILLVAATVTLFLREWVDAGVIGAALALNATIGFTQERRAEASVRALMQMLAPRARVVRDGYEQEVESTTLVPGDLVLLESGMRVPADLRLVDATRLWIDQSLLTGESLPVERDAHAVDEATETPERRNMTYAGSVITSGRGRGYIVATGMNTELGKIAGLVRSEESPETPLQARMTRLGHMIGVLVGVSAVGTFVLGVSLGEPVSHMFMVAVAMSVAAVPEGLPVAFTIVLALGVHRMARRNAIIRRLPAVETLGSTTVIGSDKTGTLTENRMLVREAWAGGQFFAVEPTERLDTIVLERGDREALSGYEAFSLALLTGVLANEATLNEQGQHQGDPTEIALLLHAAHHGIDPRTEREGYDSVAEMPFESERQYSASVREREGDHILFLKGAPERVLDVCSHILMADGKTPVERDLVQAAAEEMAARGLRVLAMAYSPLPGKLPASEQLGEPSELVFLGLQGMYDPPRAGVRQAIATCVEGHRLYPHRPWKGPAFPDVRYNYYREPSLDSNTPCSEAGKSFPAEPVDAQVTAIIRTLAMDPVWLDYIDREARRTPPGSAEARRRSLTAKRKRLVNAFIEGHLDEGDYRPRLAEIESELRHLPVEPNELIASLGRLQSFAHLWDNADAQFQHEVCRIIFAGATLISDEPRIVVEPHPEFEPLLDLRRLYVSPTSPGRG